MTKAFVDAVETESGYALKSLLLKTLLNLVGSEDGLVDAINSGAVDVCIKLLKLDRKKTSPELTADAAKTLAFICFDERGKDVALAADGKQKKTLKYSIMKIS